MERKERASRVEVEVIEYLTRDIELKNEGSKKGEGDDAAVLSYGEKKTLITTDLLL